MSLPRSLLTLLTLVALCVLALALTLAASVASAADDASTAARGSRLYHGQAGVPARIHGQDFTLPVEASRCVNCHAAAGESSGLSAPARAGAAASASARASAAASAPARASAATSTPARAGAAAAAAAPRMGPTLTPALLTVAVRRRGGPPSRYDAASLCALLRTGVDPAHVIILRTMPRYDISDADCRSLWLHLSVGGP
jgi:hypothetical protein